MIWFFLNPEEREREFRERYRRPPPSFEVVGAADVEELGWRLSALLRLDPSTGNLKRVLDAAWERMRASARSDAGEYLGSTEPLASAVPRLGVPRDGVVHLWHHWHRDREEGPSMVRLRVRDLVEFEGLMWRDDSWMIDEELGWMLAGMHDWSAQILKLRGGVV